MLACVGEGGGNARQFLTLKFILTAVNYGLPCSNLKEEALIISVHLEHSHYSVTRECLLLSRCPTEVLFLVKLREAR